MPLYLSPVCNDQMIDVNGDPLSGGQVETYLAGSSTPTSTYTSSAGDVQQANPIILNTLGYPPSPIWLTGGAAYKFVIKDAAGATLRTIDDVNGVNDSSVSASEWVASGLTPTYINTTSFSVPGDQTNVLHVNRRLRMSTTAGTVYASITAAAYSTGVSTITVATDSGALDSGLSAVEYALASYLGHSLPLGTNDGSGKWGINIRGNADTATNSTQLGGVAASGYARSTGSSQLGSFAATQGSANGASNGGFEARNDGTGSGTKTSYYGRLRGVTVAGFEIVDTGDGGAQIGIYVTDAGDGSVDRRYEAGKIRKDGIIEALGFIPTGSVGAVGTVMTMRRNASSNPGDTVAGSELFPAGLGRASDNIAYFNSSGTAASGTWKSLSYAPSAGTLGAFGLYVRIS